MLLVDWCPHMIRITTMPSWLGYSFSHSREEEHSKLVAELEKQQKVESRKSYTHRIKEITKNSRKQDADIERILKETREVQLESNSIQERLHRTYAVADEIVFKYECFPCMGNKLRGIERWRDNVAPYASIGI